MPNILLVEDSKLFGNIISQSIQRSLGYGVTWAKSLSEAKTLLQSSNPDFFLALLDLNLPDAPDGEIVDLVLGEQIPSIVFTGEFDPTVREKIWSKKIIDYVLKQSEQEVYYIIDLIGRIYRNQSIKVLVVDDSDTIRKRVQELLEVHQYQVFQADDGMEALEAVKNLPDIKMVITDYEMPRMDGFDLTRKLRAEYSKEALAIIGISAQDNPIPAAKFIKNGANDFIAKPFAAEEFYCRITHNINAIENIERLHRVESELRRAKEVTEAVNRALNDESGLSAEVGKTLLDEAGFLNNMQYEIETPVNAIMGVSHLVLQTQLTPKQRDHLLQIQSSAGDLQKTVNDILDFSKTRTGKML